MSLDPHEDVSELLANRDRVVQASYRYARSADDADEAAQETWLAALKAPQGRILSAPGWLYETVRRRVAALMSRRLRRSDVEQLSYEERSYPTPLEELAEAGFIELLHARVDRLDEKYSRVIRLRYFEGLGRGEIARRLNLPIATVATRLRRGVGLLREQFEQDREHDHRCWGLVLAGWLESERGAEAATVSGASSTLAFFTSSVARLAALVLLLAAAVPSALRLLDGPLPEERELLVLPRRSGEHGAERARARVPSAGFASSRELARLAPASGRLVVRVQGAGGLPLAGVELELIRLDRSQVAPDLIATDASGVARVPDLGAGEYLLVSDRGHRRSLTIVEGVGTELQLVVEGKLLLRGRTLDDEGQPIADAEVWAYPTAGDGRAWLAARSNHLGEFEVANLAEGVLLGARAQGWVPSGLSSIRDVLHLAQQGASASAGQGYELDLLLYDEARGFSGAVLDTSGKPIAKARVRVVSGLEPHSLRFRYGKADILPPHPETLTDDEGRFSLNGSSPYVVTVVRAEAEGFVSAEITLERRHASPPGEHVFRLEAGAQLHGTVRDSQGQLRGDVRVQATSRRTGERLVTLTAADGSFELLGLELCQHELWAIDEGAGLGESVRHELDLAVPGVHAWDAVLRREPLIFGSLEPSECEALKGCQLELIATTKGSGCTETLLPERQQQRFLDETGRFSFAVERGATYQLSLWAREGSPTALYRWSDLKPSTTGLALSTIAAAETRSSLRGQLISSGLEGGSPLAGRLELWSTELRAPIALEVDSASGAFACSGLWAGVYQLCFFQPGRNPVRLKEFDLATSAELDLGEVQVTSPGSLKITFEGEPDMLALAPKVFLILTDQHGMRTTYRLGREPDVVEALSDHEFRFPGLAAGRYSLRITDSTIAISEDRFTIRAGEETHLSWILERGSHVDVAIHMPREARVNEEPVLTYRHESGRCFQIKSPTNKGGAGRARSFKTWHKFIPGRWTLEASLEGWSARLAFSVPRSEPLLLDRSAWTPAVGGD